MYFLCQLLPRRAGAGTAAPEHDSNRNNSRCQLQIGFCAGTVQMFTQQRLDIFSPLLNSSIIYVCFFFISKFLLHVHSVVNTRNTQLYPWTLLREGSEPSRFSGDQTEAEEFLTSLGLIRFQNTQSFFTFISHLFLAEETARRITLKESATHEFFSAVEMPLTEAIPSALEQGCSCSEPAPRAVPRAPAQASAKAEAQRAAGDTSRV